MKRFTKKIALISALFLLVLTPYSFAEIVDFNITGTSLLPSADPFFGIGAWKWEFSADPGATLSTTLGSAINPSTFWSSTDSGPGVLPLSNQALDFYDLLQQPISVPGDGQLAQIEFTGTNIDLLSFEFRDYSNNPLSQIRLVSADFSDGGSVNFEVVPIPGSILLLGSGVLGLVGLSRRKRS